MLVFIITCGTSMLSVGRMVASLLLRGSNSNAAVNTMANPGRRAEIVKIRTSKKKNDDVKLEIHTPVLLGGSEACLTFDQYSQNIYKELMY